MNQRTAPQYFRQARLISVAYDGGEQPAERVGSSDDLEHIFRGIWPSDMAIRETFVAMYLDARGLPLAYFVVGLGGINSTAVDSRMVFAPALNIAGCHNIVLAHNHPSGIVTPSRSDITLTEKLKVAAEALDFHLMDHLILSPDGDCFSFKGEGRM